MSEEFPEYIPGGGNPDTRKKGERAPKKAEAAVPAPTSPAGNSPTNGEETVTGGGNDGHNGQGGDKAADTGDAKNLPEVVNRVNTGLAIFFDDLAGKAQTQTEDLRVMSAVEAVRQPVRVGLWLMLLFFGVGGLWASFAPISSAAVARGQVISESNRKTVQHLEGGIIEELLVRDGETVTAGQPLVRLRATTAEARKDLISNQYVAAKALETRLLAEQDGKDELVFPEAVMAKQEEPKVQETIATQQRLFKTRKQALEGELGVIEQRIKQLNDQIGGLRAQQASVKEQMRLIKEEADVVEKLLLSGNAQRPRFLALKRREAELQGASGQFASEIARIQQAVGEAELAKMNAENEFLNGVVKELRDVQVQISDLEQNLKASTDVFERTVISSPLEGTVVGLKFHTVGGVISPGVPIMDIVPKDDRLVVEAQVLPQDIDEVHEGLIARVRLTPYKSRRIPPLEGKVTQVSADSFTDQKTGMSYYTARVEIDANFMKHLRNVELQPGMPADVLIVTGERTFLAYLLSPLSDSMYRAFREQ